MWLVQSGLLGGTRLLLLLLPLPWTLSGGSHPPLNCALETVVLHLSISPRPSLTTQQLDSVPMPSLYLGPFKHGLWPGLTETNGRVKVG